ncbi:MAG: ribose 5-phosphate isomerase B [Phycisphaerae bacterium]|nr:MAG: ribose 5-phosphate isomerase B [Phycisphaerae bacterium]
MKIALSADHRGYAGIRQLAEKLTREGHEAIVLGDCSGAPCDYPERAWQVGKAVAEGKADVGILLCGTGIGMSIAANKVKGVRAAVVHDEMTAQLSRSHNNANVLCMSADLLGQRLIEQIAHVWLHSEFEGGRHARRVRKIAAMEEGKDPATVGE